MDSIVGRGAQGLPIRTRLALAYLFAFGIILVLFSAFIYFQVQRDLIAAVDAALELAALQAITVIDSGEDELAWEEIEGLSSSIESLDNIAIYLLDGGGQEVLSFGAASDVPPGDPVPGARTQEHQGVSWRVFTGVATLPEQDFIGWIQVLQNLAPVEQSLSRLAAQIALGIPLALALAGISGIYLAVHALRPIDRITHTAQTIDETDLDQRIDYDGPADEVGRLAATFDRMLDRLQAAFERQRRFTGDAAHELRTPLAALKARINVTRRRPRQVTEYEEALDDIDGQVDRLIRLTQQLLFIARLDHGQQRAAQESIQLDELMEMILDQIAPVAAEKSITVHSSLSSDLTVSGDTDMLIRLFLNLLDNAITYTPPGGQIDVRTAVEERMAAVIIRDNGPGIPPEHLSRLFERFYRAEADRSRVKDGRSGTGLGLAIAYEITQIHGGALIAESDPGDGATFTVRLPRA